MRCLLAHLFSLIGVLAGIGLLLTAVSSFHAGAQSQDKRFVEVPAGKTVDVKEVYGTSHALLIGINHYKNVPPSLQLHYAVKDVEDMKQVLVKSYGFQPENITVLEDEHATLANIRRALARIADRKLVQTDDRVLIYFSGHGQTVSPPDSGDMGFLIPTDADVDLSDPTNVGPYLGTCLQMTEVWNYLNASPAKHILLLADACYSGLLAAPRNAAGLNAASLQVWSGRRARQVVTAGGKGETSEENSDVGHGVFTFQLLEELRARAKEPGNVFTTTELYSDLFRAVSNQTNAKQTPQMAKYKVEGEFLFITAGKSVPPITPPLKPKKPDNNNNRIVTKTRINSKDDAVMIWIPAGDFLMGDEDDSDNSRHTVNLDGYYIYKNLVTVKQYKAFCKATKRPIPSKPSWGWIDNHPMVNVNWKDADAYCKWAGGHLPTEAQWEKAARGTDGRKYPWGNEWDQSRVMHSSNENAEAVSTFPVGSFPAGASPYGVLDMSGNVFQWCADWYDKDYTQSALTRIAARTGLSTNENLRLLGNEIYSVNPTGPTSGTERVLRGGAWNFTGAEHARTAGRDFNKPTISENYIGFRCALDK